MEFAVKYLSIIHPKMYAHGMPSEEEWEVIMQEDEEGTGSEVEDKYPMCVPISSQSSCEDTITLLCKGLGGPQYRTTDFDTCL